MNAYTLSSRVRDYGDLIGELDTRQVALSKAGMAVEESQAALAITMRALDQRQTELSADFVAFLAMPLWKRLRWLAVGR